MGSISGYGEFRESEEMEGLVKERESLTWLCVVVVVVQLGTGFWWCGKGPAVRVMVELAV